MPHTGTRTTREDDYRESRADRHVSAFAENGRRTPAFADNGRRTVTITGHPVPPRRRTSAPRARVPARPDRIALWAFLLGLFLVFMAVATANAAAL